MDGWSLDDDKLGWDNTRVACHLGNNAISIAPRTPIVHVSRGVNGGGVGNYAVSVASGASIVVVGGDVGGDDVGERIHWQL